MRSFTVQMGEEEYNILASSGECSATVEYDTEPACLEIDGDIFYAYVTDPDDQSPKVYKVDSVSVCPTTADEVEFEEGEEEEEAAGPVLVDTEDAG